MTTAPSTPAENAENTGSLRPVLSAIPPECYENPTWKGLAFFFRDLLIYSACVAALVHWSSPLIVVPLWVLTSLAISALFVVAHDAAHQSLFKRAKLNGIVGRIAMLPSWHIYSAWVYGHNRIHHGFTIRQDFDFVWHPYTPKQYSEMSRLARLRHRFEWSFAGAGAYYLREVWWNKMIHWTPSHRVAKSVRRDRRQMLTFLVCTTIALVVIAVASGASVLGCAWLVIRTLVVPFLGFAYVIGSIVHTHHVAPDIVWLRRDEWSRYAAQVQGTTVLRAPKPLNFFLHWIMVHVPHHVDMRIPMYNLEKATAAIEAVFPGAVTDEPMRLSTFIANSRRCKLFDFDSGKWLRYKDG